MTFVTAGGSVTNSGTLTGGVGGYGDAGTGGIGGTGAFFGGSGASLVNSGTISGGVGGNSGFGGGKGGVGVTFANGGTVVNLGTISGGLGGGGGVAHGSAGAAVSFSGSAGTLTNQQGGTINGDVVMGNYANFVTLQIGSQINGALNMGTGTGAVLTLTDHGTGGTQAYSAAVTGTTTFSGALSKAGTGTWILDTPLSYSGTTRVNLGTLLVNTTLSGTGAVTVAANSNGTLGGNGTIGGAVTVNSTGTLAPGNSPGILHLGSNLTLAGGSNLNIEIGGSTAGTGYDQVQVTGALTLTGSNLNVSLLSGFTPALNDKFYVVDLLNQLNVPIGTFGNAAGATLVTDQQGNFYQVNYADSDPNDPSHTLANDISLQFLGMSPVPEPSTWIAAGLAAAALAYTGIRKRTNSRHLSARAGGR